MLIFSRAVLCCLTWNSLGTEVSCIWRVDDMWTTCRQCVDDTRVRLHWRFGLADDICHLHIVRRRVCHLNVIHTCTCHLHIICQLSAPLLMVTVGLNYLLLWQEFVIWWNLWQECCIVSFQDHVNDLWDNLCWWFSLHVTSGHCSHLICICTYHLHIIWAYAYYAHIICTSPSYVLS